MFGYEPKGCGFDSCLGGHFVSRYIRWLLEVSIESLPEFSSLGEIFIFFFYFLRILTISGGKISVKLLKSIDFLSKYEFKSLSILNTKVTVLSLKTIIFLTSSAKILALICSKNLCFFVCKDRSDPSQNCNLPGQYFGRTAF